MDSIKETQYQKVSFSVQQMEKFKEFLGLSIFEKSEFSHLFIMQLLSHHFCRGYNIHNIKDEIKILEGINTTSIVKSPTQFDRLPLRGLWHKHHFQAKFIPKNLSLQLMNNNKIEEICNESNSEYTTEEMFARIAHVVTFEAYKERAQEKNITGEWIIYAKHAGKNFYLTLGSHKEGDQNIYNRIIKSCSLQYPFLLQLLQTET